MADLLLRDMDDDLKRRLTARARAHGRSLSAEAKALILRGLAAADEPIGLGSRLRDLLPPGDRGDDLLPPREPAHRDMPDLA